MDIKIVYNLMTDVWRLLKKYLVIENMDDAAWELLRMDVESMDEKYSEPVSVNVFVRAILIGVQDFLMDVKEGKHGGG